MADCFGADRWERAYGATPPESWAHALGRFTLDDLARGIVAMERRDAPLLPTLPQFVAACREFQPGTFAGASSPGMTLPQLLAHTPDSEVGRKYIAMCRRAMRGALSNDERKALPPLRMPWGVEPVRTKEEQQ